MIQPMIKKQTVVSTSNGLPLLTQLVTVCFNEPKKDGFIAPVMGDSFCLPKNNTSKKGNIMNREATPNKMERIVQIM
jgi:hypothetical protein